MLVARKSKQTEPEPISSPINYPAYIYVFKDLSNWSLQFAPHFLTNRAYFHVLNYIILKMTIDV